MELEIIGEPVMFFGKPPREMPPHPDACMITGITPQQAEREGVSEAEFAARVHEQLAEPGTCGVGYNSLRFDDEFTRQMLYRNFYEPYGREWENGNSRWDLIDLVRMCQALRPEGIVWPTARGRLAQLQARAPGQRQRPAAGARARCAVRRPRADRPGPADPRAPAAAVGLVLTPCVASSACSSCSTWRT